MTKYNIAIEETLFKVVRIEAESYDDAIKKVENMYTNREIVLSADDLIGCEINGYGERVENIDLTNSLSPDLKLRSESETNQHKDKTITIKNECYKSETYTQRYNKNDEIFISLETHNNKIRNTHIEGYKRDKGIKRTKNT